MYSEIIGFVGLIALGVLLDFLVGGLGPVVLFVCVILWATFSHKL